MLHTFLERIKKEIQHYIWQIRKITYLCTDLVEKSSQRKDG